jgi:uncharacterized protein YjiK
MTEPVAATSSTRPARHGLRTLTTAIAMAVVALLVVGIASASAAELPVINLAKYKKVAQHELPTVFNTVSPPAHSLLAEEASAVTYDWENEHLYVVGDGGTSIVEVAKDGHLLSSMTLAPGDSPQGTTFYDTEGVAFVGNGEFVITEERDRQLDKFTYVAGGDLTRAAAKTVKLGTTIGNIGLEGVTNDPVTSGTEPGVIVSKEQEPEGILQANVNWAAGTSNNGNENTVESTNLFDPSLAGVLDMSDVFALANLQDVNTAERENLLIISQESGKIVNVTRSGEVKSSLTIVSEPGNPLTVPEQTDEGVTMDEEGVLYVVNERGGGSQEHPELWVYEAQTTADTAPSAVTLSKETNELVESPAPLAKRLKVASVAVTDTDGFGENDLSVTGPDEADFEVDSNGLYLKAGTTLDAAAKGTYEVNVAVDDPAVGSDPDATTLTPYVLTVAAAAPGSSSDRVAVTEVAPWSSGNSPVQADWFELTNTGTGPVNLLGWKADDSHNTPGNSALLEGVTTLAPGQSAVFVQGGPSVVEGFESDWFPGGVPSGVQIGYYETEDGLSTGGDQVNVYNALGQHVAGVEFGASPGSAPFTTFENPQGLGSGSGTAPLLTTMASSGADGAFAVDGGNEVGSPGTAVVPTPVAVTEVAPWGSGFAEYDADWFELTNETEDAIELAGWKIDDNSHEFSKAVALSGITTLAAGELAIFVEAPEGGTPEEAAAKVVAWETSWFGASVPAALQVGTYQGEKVGLSGGGDGVNIYNGEGDHLTGIKFGNESETSGTDKFSFDNSAGVGSFTGEAEISTLSAEGVNGAFNAHDQIGSPGTAEETLAPPPLPEVKITEVDPSGSDAAYAADWFELTNEGATTVDLTGWKASDSADTTAVGESGVLTGVSSLAPGASAVFVEKAAKIAAFETAWFPGGVPSGFLIGAYDGAKGLSGTGGDQVNIFNAAEEKVTGVSFGPATAKVSLDNAAGIGDATSNPPPTISTNSVVGTNGAFENSAEEIGSPGTIENAVTPPVLPDVKITEVDPTGSTTGDGYEADWFELTNEGTSAVDLTGWKMDDNSNSFSLAQPMAGVSSLPAGASAVFVENAGKVAAWEAAWFPGGLPGGFPIGSYGDSGTGLSSGGDQVNIFNAGGEKVTSVSFGSATAKVSFDNAAGIGATEGTPPAISTLSAVGVHGAFKNAAQEIGSPGTIVTPPEAELSATAPVFPTQAANTIGPGQWVTVTNDGTAAADISRVQIEATDWNSTGDFILGADQCTDATLAPGDSCEVMVRFAPGRENAQSTANLGVISNAVNSPLSVSLTATSGGLPKGEKGDPGDPGDPGQTGQEGNPGATGAQGEKGGTGATGATGAAGASGDRGPAGPTGPAGPQGPAGKNGKTGKDGKDGVVEFVASESDAQARRGHVAHLKFKVKNLTVGALRGATVSAPSLAAKGSDSVAVDTIKAGHSDSVTLDLEVGRNASLGRHRVKVALMAGGHTVTQTVVVTVTR